MKSDDVKTVFYLALGAGAVYLGYQLWQFIKGLPSSVPDALSQAQSAAASNLTDTVQSIVGTGVAQPGETYTVTMQDGSMQTVPYGQMPKPVASAVAASVNGLGALRRPGIRRYSVRT